METKRFSRKQTQSGASPVLISNGKFMRLAVIIFIIMISVTACVKERSGADTAADLQDTDTITAYFFYEEFCDTCDDEEMKFHSIIQEKLPLDFLIMYPNRFLMFNVNQNTGRQMYAKITDDMALDRDSLELPLLIVAGHVFQGYDNIRSNIQEYFLTAAEDHFLYNKPYNPKYKKTGENLFDDYSVNPAHISIVYFYRVLCPGCNEIEPFIFYLPKTFFTDGAAVPLDVIRINTSSGNNKERLAAFYEAWQVPDEDRHHPIIFFSGSYLSGAEMIMANMDEHLKKPREEWKLLRIEK